VEILEVATRTISPDAMRAALGDTLPDVVRLLPATLRASSEPPVVEASAGIARHQMFAGVREFLASASAAQPVVLLLGDLQWADDGSVQLLRHLARTLREIRVLIVATYRDEPLDANASLAQALDEWHRKRLALMLRLHPFTQHEVEVLLQAVSGQDPPPAIRRPAATRSSPRSCCAI
jgi:predicted ATPase